MKAIENKTKEYESNSNKSSPQSSTRSSFSSEQSSLSGNEILSAFRNDEKTNGNKTLNLEGIAEEDDVASVNSESMLKMKNGDADVKLESNFSMGSNATDDQTKSHQILRRTSSNSIHSNSLHSLDLNRRTSSLHNLLHRKEEEEECAQSLLCSASRKDSSATIEYNFLQLDPEQQEEEVLPLPVDAQQSGDKRREGRASLQTDSAQEVSEARPSKASPGPSEKAGSDRLFRTQWQHERVDGLGCSCVVS